MPEAGRKGAEALDVDFDAALDHAGDQAVDERAVFFSLLDDRLDLFFAQGLARQDDETAARAVVVDSRHEAIADRRDEVVRLPFRCDRRSPALCRTRSTMIAVSSTAVTLPNTSSPT